MPAKTKTKHAGARNGAQTPQHDSLTPEIEQLYARAEEASGFNAASLRLMALLAYEQRRNKTAMKVLSHVWGRNARLLATAVTRFPDWFMEVDGTPPVAAEPDELLALFSMCALPKPDCEALYRQFRRYSLRAWQVRERVEAWKLQRRLVRGKPAQLNLKQAVVREAHYERGRGRLHLEWLGEPVITPKDWHDAEIRVAVTHLAKKA